jgi:hypothetical protein
MAVMSAVTPMASRVAERAEQHGPGGGKLHGAAPEVDAQQGDHAGEADDQAGGLFAAGGFGPNQPEREHGGEQRVGGGEDPGGGGTDVLFAPRGQEGRGGHVQQGHDGDGHDHWAQAAECPASGCQRHEERGAEHGAAEHHRGGRQVRHGHPDEQERAAPDDRGSSEQQQRLPVHGLGPFVEAGGPAASCCWPAYARR